MPASRLHLMHQQLQAAARIDADFSAVIDALAAEYEPLTPRLHHFLTVHRIFSKLSLLEIVAELKKFAQEAPHVADRHWAEETLAELNRMAPSSLAITLEMFKRASSLSFKRCLEMDFVVAQNVLRFSADFYEGVDAKLIRKTGNAAWKPASIAAMNIADITATFVNFNVPNTEKLIFKNITDFTDVSPPKRHAFPSINRDIKEFFKTANAFSHCKTKTHVVEVLCDKFSSPSKLGLKTFFSEIVDVHVFNRDVLFAEYANAAAFVPFGNKEAWLFVENPLLLKKHTLKTHISSL